jgi:type IV pilus assembly protein PilV
MRSNEYLIGRVKRHSGVSLIEVMVSILIMSIALMGIAGMQAATVRYQMGSESRSAVSSLLEDIAGRMRVNLTEVPGFGASSKYLFSDTWAAQNATAPTEPKVCGVWFRRVDPSSAPEPPAEQSCNSSERADYDLYAWRMAAREALPQGSVQLAGDVNLGLTVTLMWYDKDFRDGDSANPGQTVLRTSPSCESVTALSSTDFGQSTLRFQTCCPEAAAAPDGVRCANFTVVP